jgi:hypothetical protein
MAALQVPQDSPSNEVQQLDRVASILPLTGATLAAASDSARCGGDRNGAIGHSHSVSRLLKLPQLARRGTSKPLSPSEDTATDTADPAAATSAARSGAGTSSATAAAAGGRVSPRSYVSPRILRRPTAMAAPPGQSPVAAALPPVLAGSSARQVAAALPCAANTAAAAGAGRSGGGGIRSLQPGAPTAGPASPATSTLPYDGRTSAKDSSRRLQVTAAARAGLSWPRNSCPLRPDPRGATGDGPAATATTHQPCIALERGAHDQDACGLTLMYVRHAFGDHGPSTVGFVSACVAPS